MRVFLKIISFLVIWIITYNIALLLFGLYFGKDTIIYNSSGGYRVTAIPAMLFIFSVIPTRIIFKYLFKKKKHSNSNSSFPKDEKKSKSDKHNLLNVNVKQFLNSLYFAFLPLKWRRLIRTIIFLIFISSYIYLYIIDGLFIYNWWVPFLIFIPFLIFSYVLKPFIDEKEKTKK